MKSSKSVILKRFALTGHGDKKLSKLGQSCTEVAPSYALCGYGGQARWPVLRSYEPQAKSEVGKPCVILL